MHRKKGAITVFLSLISVLFISVLCTSIEAARIQGCRAKAAAALDMGIFSVMGEFERELLSRYDVFFLDGAAGSGSYSTEKVKDALQEYMEYNVYPNKGMWIKAYDPFALTMDETKITGVSLMTDENGEAFYQQAVGYMRENLLTEGISILLERISQGERLQKASEDYKKKDENVSSNLKELEQQKKEYEAQQEEARRQAEANGEVIQQETEAEQIPSSRNPLKVIKKMKDKGLLKLVTGDEELSEKSLPSNSPSKRRCQSGNLPVEKKYSGLTADLLFQEYLFERFPMYTDHNQDGVLDYCLEYILCGKNSDEKNLKSIATRLLILREGANFLYLAKDEVSQDAATALATLLVGAIPLPGLVTVTAYALLLAWAYGESLIDVRELLAGGKVPVFKTASSWKLGLTSIPDILDILENTSGEGTEGLSYEGYLQILFTLGGKSKYPMRALDLIEGYMRGRSATAAFRADHAICKIEAEADFTIPPLFLKVSAAFLKTGVTTKKYHAEGSFAY